ncbi:glycosyltransferase family 31 protein [Trichoderma sp. SZMC 28014]
MGAKLLPAPHRVITMKSPIVRSILGALCVFFILMATLRNDSLHVSSKILEQAGVRTDSHAKNQQPLENKTTEQSSAPKVNIKMDCNADLDHLKQIKDRYQLEDRFHFRTIELGKRLAGGDACAAPLEVEVPASGYPRSVDASDFMFGVSTTYKRFLDPDTTPINEWIFWLTDNHGNSNGGKLLLMLLDATDDQLQEVANMLGDVGIDVDVYHSNSSVEMAVRYLTLVPTLYTHPDAASKKWLVTCDDDTFFPNMHGLIEKMATFDHARDMYIGTLSEDVGAIERHGSQAFGGAGVFLSRSMAEKITSLYGSCTTQAKILESNSGWGPQGDIILRKCIYENTEVRLTTLWDLWQLDFYGHPSGFYEWGIKPLSLHHYRGGGWHTAKPGQYTKIAHACGEDCSLMRFQTTDDFIISGYSISHYPKGITFDTNQMEATLYAAPENKGWNLDFMFGPRRQSLLKTGRKISWELQESEVQSDGSVLQTYTRKRDDERWVHADNQPMSNIDGVIELVWIPS